MNTMKCIHMKWMLRFAKDSDIILFLEINFKWALDDGKGILNVKIEEMSIEYHEKKIRWRGCVYCASLLCTVFIFFNWVNVLEIVVVQTHSIWKTVAVNYWSA